MDTLLQMALVAPLVFLAVTLAVQHWRINRLRSVPSRVKPDNDNKSQEERLFDERTPTNFKDRPCQG